MLQKSTPWGGQRGRVCGSEGGGPVLEAGTAGRAWKVEKAGRWGPKGVKGGAGAEEAKIEVPVGVWVVVRRRGGGRGVGLGMVWVWIGRMERKFFVGEERKEVWIE